MAFRLGQEYYSIDVQRVTEVFVPSSITSIPQASNFVAGVINFRGVIVTVIDLKTRLGITNKVKLPELEDEDDRYYVIIVNTGDTAVGLLVDYVEAVIGINQSSIQSSIELISGSARTAFLSGIARTDLGLVVLLSLDAILADYDAAEIAKLADIRAGLTAQRADDEVVVTSESLLDLDEDDLTQADKAEVGDPSFKKIDVDSSIGTSPLDLNSLTKAELLKIAMEMEIDDVSSKTNKKTLIEKINEKMGG